MCVSRKVLRLTDGKKSHAEWTVSLIKREETVGKVLLQFRLVGWSFFFGSSHKHGKSILVLERMGREHRE